MGGKIFKIDKHQGRLFNETVDDLNICLIGQEILNLCLEIDNRTGLALGLVQSKPFTIKVKKLKLPWILPKQKYKQILKARRG